MSDHCEREKNGGGDSDSDRSEYNTGVALMKDLESMFFLSVTSVPEAVFSDADTKMDFEKLFKSYSEDIRFIYLKSFSRVRLILKSDEMANRIRSEMHNVNFRDAEMGVYSVKPILRRNSDPNLKPPERTKMFLISPPASPPLGWEPNTSEATPVINYDLLAAIASLDNKEPFVLHSGTTKAPTIVVHLTEEEDSEDAEAFHPLKALPRDMVQTRKPPMN